MDQINEEFEKFYAEEISREPAMLKGLIQGWKVLESRGTAEHRVLLIANANGEKRILKQFSHHQNARMQAEREALNAAHESGIPKLYDYAEDEHYVYLVREYVEGLNLEEYTGEHGTLNMRETARIGAQLCEVLIRLHRRNIIHRDVKPQNVILTPDQRVFLIDFDISRKYTQGEQHDTEYLGTRSIAPPEQFGYGQTDARTDIYSLGVVILYLATGSYDLRDIGKLPRPLGQVVRRCTCFAPERRYQTAAQVLRRLRALENRTRKLWLLAASAVLTLAVAAALIVGFRPQTRAYPTLTEMEAGEQVAFQEPLIERCVRAQLGKTQGEPLTYADVSAVTELYLYGDYTDGKAHDPDYQGDKVYVNDTLVNHGSVTDLTDLLLMPRLRVIRFFRQPLSNVDALAALVKLEELSLDESPNVADISAVSKLEWLRLLDISDTAVTDLSPLTGCPRLRQINLERIPCKDFSVLSRYPYLEYLNVNAASPDAVMAAVSGKMIDYLWLDYSGLTDFEPFMLTESVEQLHAKHNEITSLQGIEALTTLTYVDVAYNPITDLSPLLSLPRLAALRIDRGMAAAWDAIRDAAKFKVEWQE